MPIEDVMRLLANVMRLLAASKKLQQNLIASPLWSMLKDEPLVIEFIESTQNLEDRIDALAAEAEKLNNEVNIEASSVEEDEQPKE